MKIRVVILFPSVFPTQTSFINSRFKTSTVFVFNFIALPKFGSEVDKLIVIFFLITGTLHFLFLRRFNDFFDVTKLWYTYHSYTKVHLVIYAINVFLTQTKVWSHTKTYCKNRTPVYKLTLFYDFIQDKEGRQYCHDCSI